MGAIVGSGGRFRRVPVCVGAGTGGRVRRVSESYGVVCCFATLSGAVSGSYVIVLNTFWR